MKKTLKLIPAIAMLLISAVLVSTSTYAWFSMNTTVTATGMTVKATTDTSLVIKGTSGSGSSDSDYTAVGTNSITQTNMKPSTSADGITFGKLSAAVKVESAASSVATWSNLGAFQASDLETIDLSVSANAKYVASSVYSVKSIAETKTVYVKSVSVTSSNNDLLPAVRVAVKTTAGTLIFNPNSGTLTDGKAGKYSTEWALATPTYITANTLAASMGSFTADIAQDVTVYIWFEGQDTACFTDNVDTDNFTVELQFTSVAPGA